MAEVFIIGDDGEPEWIGTAVSVSYTLHDDDGVSTTPVGACPQCRTVPLDGQPYLCPHGVSVGRPTHKP